MNPERMTNRHWSTSVLLAILIAGGLLLPGCGGYVLKGRAVSGDYSSVELVDPDDPRLNGTGTPGVSLELIRDPESLGRKVVSRANSQGDGGIQLSVSEFGAGFLEEQWDLRVLKGGQEFAIARMELPFNADSRRILVTIRSGDGRGRNSLGLEAERILQQGDRQVPQDSAIFR